jgi:type I restriction enzyme R subunit
MPTPEAQARTHIDAQPAACGWVVQDRAALNLFAGRGVAVREFPLQTGYADYLLFVDRRAAGVIEAKAEGIPLSAVADQAGAYVVGLPAGIPHVALPLPFQYESTGVETLFRDNRDPAPRSRRVFTFHRPETLAAWLGQPETLRKRLAELPERNPLITSALWPAQIEAINNLERSFAAGRPRALIQMATGSGKTFTAVNFVYRLIKYGGAKRVLFLVDRNNLGRQTFKEFDQFVAPDDGRKFTELYNVQHLQSNLLDDVSKVHITTIQRLYSMLSGEPDFDPANEEGSLWETGAALDGQDPKEVRYNPRLPVEYYDFIVTDECHRSIYNLWRQVLEYFDAALIGLTATPSRQTFGFFNSNLVMEYSRQRAVADGVNVDGEVYRIRTRITEAGSTIERGWWVGRRDKRTRRQRWEQIDEDLSYPAEALDRSVSALSQIRTVLQAYKDSLPELFAGRNEIPKTLVFAKDDAHAEEIVTIAREVFGKGDDFCKKITYRSAIRTPQGGGLPPRSGGQTPENLISDFRTGYNPRIAVTVDMIATGTDIKPLEVLLFMRAVRSRVLFEQMLGRGTRVISETDFQSVTTTPGARKTRFIIVDAVGVTEQELLDPQTVERKRSVPLKALLEAAALGAVDDDLLASLARRIGLQARRLTPAQREEAGALLDVAGAPERFETLQDLANALLDAQDPDVIFNSAVGAQRRCAPTPDAPTAVDLTDADLDAARARLIERAVFPLAAAPELRAFLLEREILIDETSTDAVIAQGFNLDATERARSLIDSFTRFLEENRAEITALQILYNRPYKQRLDFAAVRDLAEALNRALKAQDPLYLTEELWQAYAQLDAHAGRAGAAGDRRILADLVSLVRHAVLAEELEPYPERVARRYQDWLAHAHAGKQFTPAQRAWLDEIARHIGVNVSISLSDLNAYAFRARGGQVAAIRVFGVKLLELLEELNSKLTE